jgi:3D (Asp-Asp-Asp) domain-containing protein
LTFGVFWVGSSNISAYRLDSKRVIIPWEEYQASQMNHDPTYACDPMQTVTFVINGEESSATFHGDCVKDALNFFGIVLEGADTINLPLKKPLEDGDRIEITSKTNTNQSFIIYTPLLPDGAVRVVASNNTPRSNRIVFKFPAGTQVSELWLQNLNQEEHLDKYKKVWVYVGKSEEHISIREFKNLVLNENNHPTTYVKKIDSIRAFAYSTSSTTGRGSTGNPLFPGTVAANFSKFPPGTLLYIISEDGKIPYGIATVEDTSPLLQQGENFLDVFLDSFEESCWWGARNVTVFVLEYPPQKQPR